MLNDSLVLLDSISNWRLCRLEIINKTPTTSVLRLPRILIDGFILHRRDLQRIRMCGNGVVIFNLIDVLCETLISPITILMRSDAGSPVHIRMRVIFEK